MSVKELNQHIRQSLKSIYPDNEIESLISLIYEKEVNLKKTDVLLNPDRVIDKKSVQKIFSLLEKLEQNQPVQYALGVADFYELELEVNPSVLIPRQETEELVDWILQQNQQKRLKVLDIGTGSGCIAIALAKNLSEPEVTALDIDPEALKLAQRNAEKNHTRINGLVTNILKDDTRLTTYHIIVSNPPYVLNSEKKYMHKNVLDYEPEEALFVPDDKALIFYEKIAQLGMKHLFTGGKLYFEINEQKGKEIISMLNRYGYINIVSKKDINGKDRMIKAIRP